MSHKGFSVMQIPRGRRLTPVADDTLVAHVFTVRARESADPVDVAFFLRTGAFSPRFRLARADSGLRTAQFSPRGPQNPIFGPKFRPEISRNIGPKFRSEIWY